MTFGNDRWLSLRLIGVLACLSVTTVVGREAIVNGHVASQNEFPYQVSVQVHGHGYDCGGGIIDERFILTAARCVLNRDRKFLNSHISIHAGTTDYHRTGPPAVSSKVIKIFFPYDYEPTNKQTTSDIAVLKLMDPLVMGSFAKLKLLSDDHTHGVATIAGFGWHTVTIVGRRMVGDTDGRLRYTNVDVLSKDKCEQFYPHGAVSPDEHLCAVVNAHRVTDPFSVCYGDVGSPLVTFRKVIGILSRIAPVCDEHQFPAVYTYVFPYETMIDNVMKHDHDPDMIAVHPWDV